MSVRNAPRPTFAEVRAPIPLYLPVSFLGLGIVVFVALVILAIGARSPYTHANLTGAYDPRYTRTDQIVVAPPDQFRGVSPSTLNAVDEPATRGGSLYVTAGCVGCHGLDGRGAVVGPPIAGTELTMLLQRVRQGPAGMPRFDADALTDAQVADIATFLQSVVVQK